MDFTRLLESLQGQLGATLPSVMGALLVLLVGWPLAVIARGLVRRALGLLRLNERIESSTGHPLDVEGIAAAITFYVILLVVLIAFFNALALERVSASLQSLVDGLFTYATKLAAAGVLLLVAWLLATLGRSVATRALGASGIDERLSAQAGMRPMSESLGNVLYWLVLLLFLPAVLGTLEMKGLLDPVQGMVDRILASLPNVLAAGVIGLVGWFVARILRDLVANLLAVAGADRLGERAGLSGTLSVSRLASLVVYVFVLVPALIAALNALKIEAISEPATQMLAGFMAAIPDLFGAAVILGVAYLVSGLIANLAVSLLVGAGFDTLPERIGLRQAFEGIATPSQLSGRLIVIFVMLFAAVEAANRLEFTRFADLISNLIEFGAQVLLGVVTIAVGFWLANLAHGAVQRVSGPNAGQLANIVRFSILGIVVAMGLRAMGLADDIVNLAFGLTLGAVAVAVALSFGLGGQQAAGRQMEHWLARLRGERQ
jgi:hypothetical protein